MVCPLEGGGGSGGYYIEGQSLLDQVYSFDELHKTGIIGYPTPFLAYDGVTTNFFITVSGESGKSCKPKSTANAAPLAIGGIPNNQYGLPSMYLWTSSWSGYPPKGHMGQSGQACSLVSSGVGGNPALEVLLVCGGDIPTWGSGQYYKGNTYNGYLQYFLFLNPTSSICQSLSSLGCQTIVNI